MKLTVPFHAKVNDMAFGNVVWYAATEDGLLVSHDRGLTWSMVSLAPAQQMGAASSTLSTASIRAIRTSNGNSYVWALTSRQLEVSGDGGEDLNCSRALPFDPKGSLHLQPSDENTVVLASDHGVFPLAADAGESWKQASLSELSIDDLAPVRSAVVVSTAKGTSVLVARRWQNLGTHDRARPRTARFPALRSREAGNQLVAASATEGLFVLDMASASSASADPIPASPAAQQ